MRKRSVWAVLDVPVNSCHLLSTAWSPSVRKRRPFRDPEGVVHKKLLTSSRARIDAWLGKNPIPILGTVFVVLPEAPIRPH